MRIGYPCINRTIGCSANRSFRLASYSEARLVETVGNNLVCLQEILEFNVARDILFFRITSDLVPFASHPVCTYDWQAHFRAEFREIGDFIRRHSVRISMHPDQFTLINSPDEGVFERSIRELEYHTEVLDLMDLKAHAKIQIHIGGVYGDREESTGRFVRRYGTLDSRVRKRLVIENDDRLYNLAHCLEISADTGIPVLFDVFHHGLHSSGHNVKEALVLAGATWKRRDGLPMLDYSSQKPGGRKGQHAEHINIRHFKRFLDESGTSGFDVMLEIKDKEASALRAVKAALQDSRFVGRVPRVER